LATSLTSARVGTGLVIMLSIIWVAVITTLSCSRARRIMRFCSAGTAALPTSTARSPRATMMPSLALRMDSRLGMASAALDLGDQPGLVAVGLAGHVAQLARHFHVGGVLGEAHRHVVGLEGSSRS
jgi:hypothetical protein